ncbi:MAG: DUF6152 family protein [Candidatus Rariloculaceae bacterium]
MKLGSLLYLTLLAPLAAQAHHSPNLHFIRGEIVEIGGVLTEADWQNPHTQLAVTATSEEGSEVVWLIESRGASQFARSGLGSDTFIVGEEIRIAGFPGRRNLTAIFATNILLADGRELVADNFVAPRWPEGEPLLLTQSRPAAEAASSTATAQGIFRLWGPDRSDHGIEGTGRTLWEESYPLTVAARETQMNWDRVDDNPYIRCQNGMPAIMDLATPMKFVSEDENIVLYLEEQDSVRRIHMNGEPPAGATGPFGLSSGRWEGETLIVETDSIDFPWFDQSGIPQSPELEIVERFTPSAEGNVLRYLLTATDPAVFTEPVELDRAWVWDPTEELKPYNCSWDRDDL